MPTALLFARSLPLMSVRRRARAMLQMTALFGSPARCPHRSSWLKPLHLRLVLSSLRLKDGAYPAVNISMRCCSVVPGSSLLRSPEKMPSCFSSASPAARLTSIISGCEMSRWGGIA